MLTGAATTRCPYRMPRDTAADPCADYLSLRDEAPVRRDDILCVWVVTGFEEVTALLRDPRLSSAWPLRGRTGLHGPDGEQAGTPRTVGSVRRWFMFRDGPDHARLRRLMAPLFSARALERIRPYALDTVRELLAGADDGLDVVRDLAVPLSGRIVCHVLGLPEDVAPRLESWAQDIAALLVADYLPEVTERGARALWEIGEAVSAALADPPRHGGLALLRDAAADGGIDDHDVAATAGLLVYAGFETTSTFIAKAVRTLLHTGRWGDLGTRPASSLVDEVLRFDTSVQQVARVATAPVDISGHRVEAGDLVLLMLGVADRDPSVFDTPDRLLPDRAIARHLAFGQGRHYCLGAGLARLEAEIALTELHTRWPVIHAPRPPVVRPHNGVMVFEHLEIRAGNATKR
ncbi:hypothetical protein N566_04810 [Streptomycetaceae bacterium MP113-05]|nr:hypothetical protein N566_04810 [Streptomycetaceae bacterium MP113-05]